MREIILLLDFGVPLFFFLLGRSLKSAGKKKVIRESALVFCLALFFGPVLYWFGALPTQAAFCGAILFLQCFAVCRIGYDFGKKTADPDRVDPSL